MDASGFRHQTHRYSFLVMPNRVQLLFDNGQVVDLSESLPRAPVANGDMLVIVVGKERDRFRNVLVQVPHLLHQALHGVRKGTYTFKRQCEHSTAIFFSTAILKFILRTRNLDFQNSELFLVEVWTNFILYDSAVTQQVI